MAFDFAALKAAARRTVHDTLSVPASYMAPGSTVAVELRVRWYNKLAINGDLVEAGYAEMIEGINRVFFDRAELAEKGVSLQFGGRLTMTGEGMGGTVLSLASQEPDIGPVVTVWRVVQ